MERQYDDNLRDGEDLESLFDVFDIINNNFVAEVEEEMARSKTEPELASIH